MEMLHTAFVTGMTRGSTLLSRAPAKEFERYDYAAAGWQAPAWFHELCEFVRVLEIATPAAAHRQSAEGPARVV